MEAALIVVAGAMIAGGKLLVAQRDRPPELAGMWELPGGKVAQGESEVDALTRELREELGVEVAVGERVGNDVDISETMTLRAYRVTCVDGTPRADDHRALRWVTAAELEDVEWVPADRGWLPDLAVALTPTTAIRPQTAWCSSSSPRH
jgi:8-oxo-dGTP diphosphatase